MLHRRVFPFALLVSACAASLAAACGSSDDSSDGATDAATGDDGTTADGTVADGASADGSQGTDGASGDGSSTDAPSDQANGDASDAGADVLDAAHAYDGDAATAPLVHQLATGGAHACVIRNSGQVRCWGSNTKGQLGDGSDGGTLSGPVDVVGLTDAVELTAGYEFTCARRAGGTVQCWGDGYYLGNGGDAGSSSVPVDVVGLTDAVQISARSYHTCAVLSNHHVACWGANSGRIGDGTATPRPLPTEPIGPMDAGHIDDAVNVGTGWGDTCIVHQDHTMTCSGEYNPWGQLGDGFTVDRLSPVSVLTMSTAIETSLGYYTSCARLLDGTLQCWGNNQGGQLGIGTSDQVAHASPVDVPGVSDLAEIASAGFGTCALTQTGQVYCWGTSVTGSSGGSAPSPKLVPLAGPAVEVSGGGEFACARLASGAVQCWGSDYHAAVTGDPGTDGGLVVAPHTVAGL